MATGSPFEPVTLNGKTMIPSQCNNMYVFPGIGLAASVAGITEINDQMLYASAVACVDAMTPEEIGAPRSHRNERRHGILDATLPVTPPPPSPPQNY